MEETIMDRNPAHMATKSTNSTALGVFMFIGGLIVTFGTYGVGIVVGLPLMLMGIAYPLWRRSQMRADAESLPHQRNGSEMSQEQAAHTGGVVMTQGEANRVAAAAHKQIR